MGDHGSHAIRRAPDGSITFLIGNNTYVGAPPVNDDAVDKAASPNWNNVKERQFLPQYNDPRFGNSTRIGVHATLWRLQPSNKSRCCSAACAIRTTTPTTSPARRSRGTATWNGTSTRRGIARCGPIHMIPGGDAGYRNGTGKFQDEYFDAIPALRHLRRGSPVGVETYQSYAYPEKFFDNLFEADWSRGRLLYTALTPNGATYRGREDLAEFVHGEPMPITDLEVGPDGNIYFTTGGNAGQGGLYKVTWTGAKPAQPDMTGILARRPPAAAALELGLGRDRTGEGVDGRVVRGRARKARAQRDRRVGATARARFSKCSGTARPPSPDLLKALMTDKDANVRAAAVYVAGVQTSDGAKAVAAAALKDASPIVKRRAAEALVRQGLTPAQPSFAPVADIYALLAEPRSVRALLRPPGARAHAAHRVGQAGHGRDERRRADRRPARAHEHDGAAGRSRAASDLRQAHRADEAADAAGRAARFACCGRSRSPRPRRATASIRKSGNRCTRAHRPVPGGAAGRHVGRVQQPAR